MAQTGTRTILLTGATGFVGEHLWPVLRDAGYTVRCLTRDAVRARARWPDRAWVPGDSTRASDVLEALTGCQAAYYLVHDTDDDPADYRSRELSAAVAFARAAAAARLSRIVYLGGHEPKDAAFEHLATRLDVGRVLRTCRVPTLELRAAMIIGHGSTSWRVVRDLATRRPIMGLPRWLRSRTRPVSIDDAVVALVRALDVELPSSSWYDLDGPEVLDGREILERTAMALGLTRPLSVEVPLLSRGLSAQWVRLFTRATRSIVRDVVLGFRSDAMPAGRSIWPVIAHEELEPFHEAARRALAEESFERSDVSSVARSLHGGIVWPGHATRGV